MMYHIYIYQKHYIVITTGNIVNSKQTISFFLLRGLDVGPVLAAHNEHMYPNIYIKLYVRKG